MAFLPKVKGTNRGLGRRTLLGAGLAAFGTGAARGAATSLAIDTSGARCVVPVLLDGRPARMVLDTGAELTVMSSAGVARLGLPLDPWVATTLRGAGGRLESHPNAIVRTATLSGASLSQRGPGRALSLSVTGLDLGGADGLLGGDLLRPHTLELDVPDARLSLIDRPDAVAGAIGLTALRRSLLLAPLSIDGHALTALVDTGAERSLINARGLHRLGLSADSFGEDPAVSSVGVGGTFTARQHRFSELRLGPLTIANPVMLTAAVPEPAYDLLLGLDVLGRQRLQLSYADLLLSF